MKIIAQKCLNCGDIVYSRANHDFRYCYCGSMYVDGGPNFKDSENFTRVGGNFHKIKGVEYELDIPIKESIIILYQDYNKGIDKYGRHRDPNYSDEVREAAKAKNLLNE